MRSSSTILALASLFAFTAYAQDASGLPQCSIQCFQTAIEKSGCDIVDVTCQCTTGAQKITDIVTPCVQKSCGPEDLAKIEPATKATCAKVPKPAAAGGASAPAASTTNKAATGTMASVASMASASAMSGMSSMSMGIASATASVPAAASSSHAAGAGRNAGMGALGLAGVLAGLLL